MFVLIFVIIAFVATSDAGKDRIVSFIFAFSYRFFRRSYPVCGLKHSVDGTMDGSRCFDAFTRWSYDPTTNKCVKFIYSGCHGNGNNFLSEETYEEICIKGY